MNIRQQQEEFEARWLSCFASKSMNSKGREQEEPLCDMRTVYQRDRDRILHSKAFRRLKHKTQVFLAPEGDHYRTRLTHTLEVSQIARTIARALRLNEDLTEAIALGHDLGHTPFGHIGEDALNEICGEKFFAHSEQSIRIVKILEKEGNGLNLTKEVLDGIRNHQTCGFPKTLEGQIVRLSDKIAYINHDIDDAIRGGILKEKNIPKIYTDILGKTVQERLNTMVHDIVEQSIEKPEIQMSKEVKQAMMDLREFMFEHVYLNPKAKGEEKKVRRMLQELYHYYYEHTNEISKEYQMLMEDRNELKERVVCDYIAGMTDGYSIAKFKEIFLPKSWK